jgi:hypothetical protein
MVSNGASTGVAHASLQTPPVKVLEAWRQSGVTDDVLAGALEVAPRALERWQRGMYPQIATRQRLAAMEALHAHLRDTFTDDDAIREWLHADNRYLGGLRPVEALKAGRIDRVEAALEAIDSGVFV